MTNLKMSTIHNGHYHPLSHAGRAVRPDGYNSASIPPLPVFPYKSKIRFMSRLSTTGSIRSFSAGLANGRFRPVLDLPGCRWQRCPRRPPIHPKHRNRACSPACAEFRRWWCFRHVKRSLCYPSVTPVAYIANTGKLSVCLKAIIIFRQIDYLSNYLHILGRK
jgi:hypothetical protein